MSYRKYDAFRRSVTAKLSKLRNMTKMDGIARIAAATLGGATLDAATRGAG